MPAPSPCSNGAAPRLSARVFISPSSH
jgi:hypothetical protein